MLYFKQMTQKHGRGKDDLVLSYQDIKSSFGLLLIPTDEN